MSGMITNEDVSGAFETMEALGRLSAPKPSWVASQNTWNGMALHPFLVSGLPSQNERWSLTSF